MNPEFHVHSLDVPQMSVLLLGTAGVAILHTLAGPDHYLPFIVIGRARRWSTARTIFWTTLCGFGHVGSSVLLALVGVLLGFGLERVQFIEGFRGNLAAWAMIAFGLVYLVWGIKRAARGEVHDHDHGPHGTAVRPPTEFRLTPWVLFTLFVFGPCEPMIPLVMYPAAQGSWLDVWTVVATFSLLTIGVMLVVVLLALKGLRLLPTRRLERYNHAVAGGTILLAGCAIQFLGL
jgi:nickel/cobalt exporter